VFEPYIFANLTKFFVEHHAFLQCGMIPPLKLVSNCLKYISYTNGIIQQRVIKCPSYLILAADNSSKRYVVVCPQIQHVAFNTYANENTNMCDLMTNWSYIRCNHSNMSVLVSIMLAFNPLMDCAATCPTEFYAKIFR